MSMRKRVQKAFATVLSFQLSLGFGMIPVSFQMSQAHAASQQQGSDLAQRTQSAVGTPCAPDQGWVNSHPPEMRQMVVQQHYAECQPKFEKMMNKAQEFDQKLNECVERHGHYDNVEMAKYLGINNKIGSLASAGGGGIESTEAANTIKTEQAAQSANMEKHLADRQRCLEEAGQILQEFDDARNKYNTGAFLDKKILQQDHFYFAQVEEEPASLGKFLAKASGLLFELFLPSASAGPVQTQAQSGDTTEPSDEDLSEEQLKKEEDDAEKKGMDKNMLAKLLPLLAIAGLAAAMMAGGDDEEPPPTPSPEPDDDPIECADGEVANEDGTACVADTDGPCEAEGMERNEAGVCVVADGSCTASQYPDDQGVCIDIPSCEDGEYFNRDVRACIAKTCPVGQILQADGSCKDDGDETIQIADPDATPRDGDDEEFASGDDGDGEAGLSEDGTGGGLGAAGAAGAAGAGGSGDGSADGSSGRGFNGFRASGRSPAGAGGAGGGYGGSGFGSNSRNKKGKGGKDAQTVQRFLRWKNPVVYKTLQEAASED